MDARLILPLCALVGCSSSAADEAPPSCGSTPVTIEVRTNAGNVFIPAPSVTVSYGCASAVTDDRGLATAQLSSGSTYAPRFTRAGLSPTLAPELVATPAVVPSVIVLRDTMGAKFGLTATAPLVWVKVEPGAKCPRVDGVVLSVEGYPEAKVEYVSGDGPIDPKLTSTSDPGTAWIRGLTAGIKVRVLGSKPGCTIGSGPWGALPLENGVLSSSPLFLE